ncbi:MAG TPA: Ig-like domain-containing protein [Gaiellaceae bacterium]
MPIWLRIAVTTAIALAFPAAALAGTTALQPFPTNLDTVADSSQVTGLRVNVPLPPCASFPSDCADDAVLNSLDGFNIQPRIRIPFSGPIDVSTVSSSTIFLVGPAGHVVGINQPVYEPLTSTLYVESDEQLAQDSTYLLVVTNGIHDANGDPVDTTSFRHDLNFGQTKDPATKAYRKALLDSLSLASLGGAGPDDIAAASLFTTQSISALSEKVRDQIRSAPAPTPNFNLAPDGSRTVFSNVPGLAISWNRQTTVAGPLSPTAVPVTATQVFPGSIAKIAYGSFASPDYENSSQIIPAVGTLTGVPAVQSVNQLVFTLFVPSGVTPAGGWPVAVFGHGFGDSMNGAPWAVASSLAQAGIATIAINVVGHGFGSASTYTVSQPVGPTETFTAGGRGFDQNGSGTIDSTEGVNAAGGSIVSNRDGLRQTVFDIEELIHMVQSGVDVNGDGTPDLSTSRIYYTGQSFGGIYGVELLGLEPTIHAGVANVPGGPIVEIARLSPSFRPLVGIALITRSPSLYNVLPPNASFTNFNENMPLRNLPLVVDTVAGAAPIQDYIDNSEWAQQTGNPEGWAPLITAPVIIQFARGDQTVPNPTATRVIRAGNLASRATLFRNDLAHAAFNTSKNPHTFLTNLGPPGTLFALEAQAQIATFFASNGTVTIDPDGAAPYFETPTSMLPEDLAYIP